MTDSPTGNDLFTMTPTSDAYIQLASQVANIAGDIAELQAGTPATHDGTADGDVTEDDLEALYAQITELQQRSTRHRAELEEIKKKYNSLIRYLDSIFNGTTVGVQPQPAAMVTAQDTVQPQNRNMVQ